MKNKNYFILAIGVFFLFAGLGCEEEVPTFKTNLSVWGVFDNEGDYRDVFSSYAGSHPFVDKLSYRKFSIDTYKKDLINALASGKGPDIYMIHNTWLPEFIDKVESAPPVIVGAQDVSNQMVDVMSKDAVFAGHVFALAPSVDSLALYYNRDIFNAAGITSPPTTWTEFDNVVKRLTRIGDDGRIIQSGAALGTADNINRSMDILTVLMMQGGTQMMRDGAITFDRGIGSGVSARNPGKDALLYYTSFARGGSPVYTWNDAQHYSIDSFFEGTTAMTISYAYNYDTIRTKNEKMNFGVAPLPQIDTNDLTNQVNHANYWMFVVAKNHDVPRVPGSAYRVTNAMQSWESWQFLRAFTLSTAGPLQLVNPINGKNYTTALSIDLTQNYLQKTRKPAARKDLINAQKTDARYGPFARGNLIARSWLRKNADAVDLIFVDMIKGVNRGQSVDKALQLGAQRAQQIIK